MFLTWYSKITPTGLRWQTSYFLRISRDQWSKSPLEQQSISIAANFLPSFSICHHCSPNCNILTMPELQVNETELPLQYEYHEKWHQLYLQLHIPIFFVASPNRPWDKFLFLVNDEDCTLHVVVQLDQFILARKRIISRRTCKFLIENPFSENWKLTLKLIGWICLTQGGFGECQSFRWRSIRPVSAVRRNLWIEDGKKEKGY